MTGAASLGDLCDIDVGPAFASGSFSDEESGPRLLRGDNVVPGRLRWDGAKYWPPGMTSGYEQSNLRVDDVILAMDRPWIEAGLKQAVVRSADLPALLVQRVARLRAHEGVEQRFLRWLIAEPRFTTFVRSVSTGSTIPHISRGQIASYPVSWLPDPSEQRAIAGVLGALDDKIDCNRRLSGTIQALLRGMFDGQRTTGDGWVADVVGSVRDVIDPKSIDPETPYVGLDDMDPGSVWLGRWGTARTVTSGKVRFRAGDILFGKLRPYFAKVAVAPLDGVCSSDILVLRPNRAELRASVLLLMSSTPLIEYATAASTGTRMPRVSWGDLARYPLPFSFVDRTAELGPIAQPLLDRANSTVAESRSLAAIRDALLPKLMSGEVRVREAAEEVAAVS